LRQDIQHYLLVFTYHAVANFKLLHWEIRLKTTIAFFFSIEFPIVNAWIYNTEIATSIAEKMHFQTKLDAKEKKATWTNLLTVLYFQLNTILLSQV